MKKPAYEAPKKKFNPIWIIPIFIVLCVAASMVPFIGPSLIIDILHMGKKTLTTEEVIEMFEPGAARNYQYPKPAAAASERTVNCAQISTFIKFPRSNPLCLNIFQTTSAEMQSAVETGAHDRIVLYGERSVFDAPTESIGTKNYIAELYQTVKFMDQIAIPKFLSAYGLTDVSYITEAKPYSYLYYRISSLEESDALCNYRDTSEKIRGCAQGYWTSVIPITAIGPQTGNASPVLRTSDNARFSYLTKYPADCFANEVFTHETAHLLNNAVMADTGNRVMETWLTEQIAGFFELYGADLACGTGTVTLQRKPDVKDVPKALVEFNSVFAAASLSHDYPKSDTCHQAMLTQWYRMLGKGDFKANFMKFFVTQRKSMPSITDDMSLMTLLLDLDGSPDARKLLKDHGCALE